MKVEAGDAIFLRTRRWLRREQLGPWQLYPAPPGEGEAGYHVSVVPWIRSRDVAVVGADVSNDVTPARVGDAVLAETRRMPVHSLVIVAIGDYVVDAMDLRGTCRDGGEAESVGVHGHRRAHYGGGWHGGAPQLDGNVLTSQGCASDERVSKMPMTTR